MRTRLGPDVDEVDPGSEPVDLRLVPAAVAIWVGVLIGLHVAALTVVAGAGAAAVLSFAAATATARTGYRLAMGVALLALLAGLAAGSARAWTVHDGPVADLAEGGATVTVDGVVTAQPSTRSVAAPGEQPYVVGRLRVEGISGRGTAATVRTPVLLVGTDPAWSALLPGTRVSVRGRLTTADGDLAAILRTSGPPDVTGPPWAVSRLTEPLRQGLRDAVADLADAPRGLVPGLAVGDESRLPTAVRDDMQATGLTHLTAVSGMHVSIVLVAVLGVARWAGVRGYAIPAVAVAAIIGFAVLVRPDPSVIRASTMGLIGVLGLTVAGRKRALPALAAAVVVLLLVDPWLARSIGFTLSVLSTAGILVLAPVWRDALPWLPRACAEAVAVPLAAQVASVPVLVGFVSETSLASVPANVLVAPAVAPATLLGVLAAVTAPALPPVAAAAAWLAGWPATWIALVAEHGAALPGAVVHWPGGTGSIAASTGLVVAMVAALPRLFRRPMVSTGVALFALVVLVFAPTPGWPPRGWLVVACAVNQGDAFVVNAGPGSALVVDAGPDPVAMGHCLDDLRVRHVPVLVLTHFHADHVDGVPGVLDARRVDEAVISSLPEPAEQAEYVGRWLAAAGVPTTVAAVGEERAVGSKLRFRVVWPGRIIGAGEPAANDASVVLDATVDGVRMLLTGDIEPPAQRALLRSEPDLRTDVLKVPHHGSRYQEPDFLARLGAQIALIGVGPDNRHGHPAPETIELLESQGMVIGRTDVDGALAIVRTADGQLGVAARGAGIFAR